MFKVTNRSELVLQHRKIFAIVAYELPSILFQLLLHLVLHFVFPRV